ncbi:undecaprenyldiphospho-muramoylpentapeptide beta-N-acetylglucosaminyltransferase [Thiomicrorhabdus sp.]|uniref:undecaprenyldiphospho-muramoylpentapeptide beta-N-acetylglucosaminyltransferase n=1 Tax=Thiomicrorhabdus sp. TaxID=2039724 RepID=UPI0029C6A409|nr:undecaprenyldiphospho-muramoylpentapeptide beta-N-acetylglucosaminyltransferase [Thiomicrorhabdus sp.]
MARIMVMAGGTGGHVFPGLALAEALKSHGVETVWLGTKGGMEREWVEKAGLPFYEIPIRGLRGNGLLGWLKAPMKVAQAWWQARRLMKKLQPQLVLGMGGFVCGPGGLAAKSLGLPLVLHEQNAIPGLTNKLLAPLANRIISAFPQQALRGEKVMLLGNPVRAGLESLPTVARRKPWHLLVLGGSRGALALNTTLPKALALLPEAQRPQVRHQTGEKTLQEAREAYAEAGVQAEILAFIDDMVEAYQQADLVLCRSGALTVSELMAAARPAIMVPYPHAVDDHQTANAQALVDLQGGEIIQQNDLTPELLRDRLLVWGEEKRSVASDAIRQKAPTQASEKIVGVILEMLKNHCQQGA